MDIFLEWGWSFLQTFIGMGSFLAREIPIVGVTVGELVFTSSIVFILGYKTTKFFLGFIDIFT